MKIILDAPFGAGPTSRIRFPLRPGSTNRAPPWIVDTSGSGSTFTDLEKAAQISKNDLFPWALPRKVDTLRVSYAAWVSVAELSASKSSGARRLHQESRLGVL
ncbi:hypothetical protein D9V82_11625 [Corynebacterium macginleyi]|nr:hypothetical protein D9V82_11625 [Corynebacterium macginleyi]